MTPVELRAKNAERMRRYRAGYRSPWGRGRAPNAKSRVVLAARAVLAAIMDRRDGWSVFDEFRDNGQEAVAALAAALRDLDAS